MAKFIDYVKINKFTESMAAFGLYDLATSFSEGDTIGTIRGTTIVGLSIVGAIRQNNEYDDVVTTLKRKGYKERYAASFMKWPCGRSIIKTALKRTGYFHKYSDLKQKYKLKRIY